MRILFVALAAILLTHGFSACKSSGSTSATFCDTACLKDTIRFIKAEHPLKPYVYISAANCKPDSLMWSYENMGVNRKIGFADVVGADVHINKDYISCYIRDTIYAWLRFNDCSTGRGFILKVPYSRKEKMSFKTSALNSFDPKFSVEEGLIAYTDRGNLFAEDMETGKTAMVTFGSKADIDYDVIHETVDSVNVTHNRLWAKVKIGENWKVIEKEVEFK